MAGAGDLRQQRILRGPRDRCAEAERRGRRERVPGRAHGQQQHRAGRRQQQAGDQGGAGAEAVGEAAAERVADQGGERDRRDGESGERQAEPPHRVQVDEQERQRHARPEGRERVAAEHDPGGPGETRDHGRWAEPRNAACAWAQAAADLPRWDMTGVVV
jgi:hypothetical protein